MAICDRCSLAIRNLRPHDWPPAQKPEVKTCVRLPRFRRSFIIECWICCKFSQWLEVERPEVLEAWRKKTLLVEFAAFGRIHVDRAGPGVLAPFFIEILPAGCSKDDLGCEVELNSTTDASMFIFPGESFLEKYPAHVVDVNCSSDIFSSQVIASKFKGIDKINLDLVRTWYNQCIKHHDKCKEGFSAPWFPTRLLYLGSQSREVKLIISGDDPPSGPYMSLSHRWGDSQKYTKLESSTIIQL